VPCSGLFNTVERYVFSFMLQHLYIQIPLVPVRHKPGRMNIYIFLQVYKRFESCQLYVFLDILCKNETAQP